VELVVDANILVAGFIRAAVTREMLMDERLSLWTPESGITESIRVLASVDFRRRFGKKSAADTQFVFLQLTAKICVVPLSASKHLRVEALQPRMLSGPAAEEFMFRLSQAEKDELVSDWHRLESMKHSSALPHAFTEHAILPF
jgi:hypothetical protein